MIRDFNLKHPLRDSTIHVWVLPVEKFEGCEGYKGYSVEIPTDGAHVTELYRNKKLLPVGLKEKWPRTEKCHFCLSTMELAFYPGADCPWGPGDDYAVCATCHDISW